MDCYDYLNALSDLSAGVFLYQTERYRNENDSGNTDSRLSPDS